MFIELTDHLRCPADHDESFLVLIPHRMDGRTVEQGVLGCPVCRAEYPIEDGVVRFGVVRQAATAHPALPAEAALAFLGLEGPGGYLALAGSAAACAAALGTGLPGIHLVLVNPAEPAPPGVSVLVSPVWPLKARSLRGVVLGAPWGGEPAWRERAVRSVLPGLRAVGHGAAPEDPDFDLLAEAGGWWVGRRG